MRLLLASSNQGKLREIRALWPDVAFLTLADFPGIEMPEETGTTFQENAALKARAIAKATGETTLAEDSGLVVPALGGRPGIHSSRWAGPTDADRVAHLLGEMAALQGSDRRAAFVAAVALVIPDGREWLFEGRLEGEITVKPHGKGGFGYDPVFWVPELGSTLAEVPMVKKNALSHRHRALAELRRHWPEIGESLHADRNRL